MRKLRLKLGSVVLLFCVSIFLFTLTLPYYSNKGDDSKERLTEEVRSLQAQLRYSELRILDKQIAASDVFIDYSGRESARTPRQRRNNWTSLRLPTAFGTLGYLNNLDEVLPRRVISSVQRKHEPRRLVIGVPTVLRSRDIYVHDTLNSLLYGGGERVNGAQDMLVMVAVVPTLTVTEHNGENGSSNVSLSADSEDQFVEQLAAKFAGHVEAGRLELLIVPHSYYPDFGSMRWQLGDGPTRSVWRMKQVLDAAYLMMYARQRGVYYLHLEDDVLCKRGFADSIDAFISAQSDDDWFMLEFSRLGFIAKLFRTRDLDFLSQYLLLFYPFKPVDWLVEYLLETMVCSPERDATHCNAMKSRLRRTHPDSLFQHIGHFSSLDGKVQKLQDASFGKPALFRGHQNPLAELTCSIVAYQQFTAQAAYEGVNFFWGLSPAVNDCITVQFVKPHVLSRYYIHSGNPEHPADKCLHAVVEVRFARSSTSASDYVTVGQFDQFGEARSHEALVRAPLGPLAEFRIRVTQNHSTWVIINEILIA